MGARLYVLEVNVNLLEAEVTLNDASVFRASPREGLFSQLKVNPWVVAGRNTVKLLLKATPEPGGEPPGRGHAFCTAAVIRGEQGRWPTEEDWLGKFEWAAETRPVSPESPTLVWQLHFDVTPGFGRWSWEDGRAGELRAQDRLGISGLVQRLHGALAGREESRVAEALQVKTSEIGRALSLPEAALRADLVAGLQEWFSDPSWRMSPLDTRALQLLPSAGGRLVRVLGPDGGPPLLGRSGDRPFSLDLTVSNLRGEWTVVR